MPLGLKRKVVKQTVGFRKLLYVAFANDNKSLAFISRLNDGESELKHYGTASLEMLLVSLEPTP
jgi:hypothetical protein